MRDAELRAAFGTIQNQGFPAALAPESHLLVQVSAEKHAEDAEQIHFDTEAERHLQKDQIDRKRRIDAGGKITGKDILNGAVGRHDMEDLAKNSAEHAPDQDEYQQDAYRFSHPDFLLPVPA